MEHQKYMKRCLSLAKKGLGRTYPNPLVGSVIVFEDKIIGEGWHQHAGGPHAEVRAIASVQDKNMLKDSTLYVNLEPCNHFGKTPPCSDLILKYHIPRVVVGCVDTFEKVNGSGIEKLKSQGVEVVVGILERESKALNKRFFTYHQKKRPYIILKWAQSKDGYLAPKRESRMEKAPVFISSRDAQVQVHQWRAEEQALLVGVQTVIDDDPSLTTRWVEGPHPTPIVLDPNDRIQKDAKILQPSYRCISITKKTLGIEKENSPNEIIIQSLEYLYHKKIQSIIVEGGAKTLIHFIENELWDEARIFTSDTLLKDGIKSPDIEGETASSFRLEFEHYQLLKKGREKC